MWAFSCCCDCVYDVVVFGGSYLLFYACCSLFVVRCLVVCLFVGVVCRSLVYACCLICSVCGVAVRCCMLLVGLCSLSFVRWLTLSYVVVCCCCL